MAGVNLVTQLREGPGSADSGGDDIGSRLRRLVKSSNNNSAGLGGLSSLPNVDKAKLAASLFGIWFISLGQDLLKTYTDEQMVEVQTRQAKVDAEIAQTQKSIGRIKQLESEKREIDSTMERLNQQLQAVQRLGLNRNLVVRMVDFVVTEMPPNIWVKDITVDLEGRKIHLDGSATTLQTVSEFVKRLEGAVFFPNWTLAGTDNESVTLNVAGRKGTSPIDAKKFSISAVVTPP